MRYIIFALLITIAIKGLNVDRLFVETLKLIGGPNQKFHEQLNKFLNGDNILLNDLQKRLELICHYAKFRKKCVRLSKFIYNPVGPKALDPLPYISPLILVLKSVGKMRSWELMLDLEEDSVHILFKINSIANIYSKLRDQCKLYREIYFIRDDKPRHYLFSECFLYLTRLSFAAKIFEKLEQAVPILINGIFDLSHGLLLKFPYEKHKGELTGHFKYFPKPEFALYSRLIKFLQPTLPNKIGLERESWRKFLMSLTYYPLSFKIESKNLLPEDLITLQSCLALLQGSIILLERSIVIYYEFFQEPQDYLYLEIFDNLRRELR